MLGNRSVSDFRLSEILQYYHVHSELTWAWDPNLSMKFTSVSHTPYAHSPKSFYALFVTHLCFGYDPSHVVRGGIFYSWGLASTPESVSFWNTLDLGFSD